MTKNKNVAAIISFLLCGLGQLYLGNYARGIVSFIIGAILTSIFSMIAGATVGTVIMLIFDIYFAYDAIECTNAMNDGTELPKLFTVIDI